MKKVRGLGAFLCFVLGLFVFVAMGAYTSWNYNTEDLHGANSIQARMDAIHTLITTTWTNAINTTSIDGLKANGKAASVHTNGSATMSCWVSVTNGQTTPVVFPVAFGAAPKVWGQWRENNTGAYGAGTNGNHYAFHYVSTVTNLTPTTAAPPGGPVTNLDLYLFGDAS